MESFFHWPQTKFGVGVMSEASDRRVTRHQDVSIHAQVYTRYTPARK